MSVTLTYTSILAVVETLETNVPFASASDKTVTHNGLDQTLSGITAGTAASPSTKVAAYQKALSAGAATIDLTAIPGVNGVTQDMSGLRVQFAKFRNPSGNANPITIGEGASNGYEMLGNGWTILLDPGCEILLYNPEASPDVAGAAKTIDLAGTGSQALDIILVAG